MPTYTILLFAVFLQLTTLFIEAKPKTVKMDSSCLGKNYCMKMPDDYPQKKFQKIMRDLKLRSVDDTNGGKRSPSYKKYNDIDTICEQKTHFEPIYQIVDKAGDVRYVAQIPEFIQKYIVVECAYPGRVTYGGNVFAPDELEIFNVTCVETSLDHKFLVLSHDGEKVETVSSLDGLPASCSCRYNIPEL